MNAERLTTLAEFLRDKVPADRLDMSDWVTDGPDGGSFAADDCGTAACACGWATRIPEFAAAGFRLNTYRTAVVYQPTPDGPRTTHWEAVFDFFGLSGRQATYLFSGRAYLGVFPPTPADVAHRILRFVKFGGEVPTDFWPEEA